MVATTTNPAISNSTALLQIPSYVNHHPYILLKGKTEKQNILFTSRLMTHVKADGAKEYHEVSPNGTYIPISQNSWDNAGNSQAMIFKGANSKKRCVWTTKIPLYHLSNFLGCLIEHDPAAKRLTIRTTLHRCHRFIIELDASAKMVRVLHNDTNVRNWHTLKNNRYPLEEGKMLFELQYHDDSKKYPTIRSHEQPECDHRLTDTFDYNKVELPEDTCSGHLNLPHRPLCIPMTCEAPATLRHDYTKIHDDNSDLDVLAAVPGRESDYKTTNSSDRAVLGNEIKPLKVPAKRVRKVLAKPKLSESLPAGVSPKTFYKFFKNLTVPQADGSLHSFVCHPADDQILEMIAVKSDAESKDVMGL